VSGSGNEGGNIFQLDGGGGQTCQGGTTCAQAGANCGDIPDGCGSIIHCGDCTGSDICGPNNVCGPSPCVPQDCTAQGFNCGKTGDGCGNLIDCGSCTDPADTCGGAGQPGKCGHSTVCVPQTCAQLSFNCGVNGDGCGGTVDCGTCTVPGEFCGGNQSFPSVCGKPPCSPKTCAQQNANCGPVSDGCGGLLSCGACSSGQICGATTANQCGTDPNCTNLCLQQTTCANPNVTTTISGVVYAPNGVDPLPNALVYVPNGTVQPFTAGVTCDNCGAAASGAPLVKAYSAVDGTFKITNAPVGANIPLVIQIGRWRRQFTIPNVTACQDNPQSAANTHLPRTKTEGDIPLMAFSTGSVDTLECVMRKIGVADSEFTKPSGTGRIHLYQGNGSATSGGATAGTGTPTEDTLWGTQATLNKYDMVLFPCQGAQYNKTAAAQSNLINYANAGGRIFATHYSYVWLYNDAPFSTTAAWSPKYNNNLSDQTGYIDTTFPKGLLLAQWLMLPAIKGSTTLGQIPINTLREDFTAVNAPSQLWMTINDSVYGTIPMHFTFNTPVGVTSDMQCGRAVFSDFHVENANNAYGQVFPAECPGGAMTAQEKLLEFMLFDLASCVTSDTPTCTPKTCTQQGYGCGQAGDGCNNVLDCGTCPAGQTCNGTPSTCSTPTCTPKTCAQLNVQCGPAGDGCGNLIQCGTCPAGQTCGGGGQPGVCGNQICTPRTCAQANVQCGPTGDGCGGVIQCGTCPAGQTCGGGGTPGVCGAPPCTPRTCVQAGAQCGIVVDGCGHTLDCGSCPVGQGCNANNQCTIIG
jgi:hypothetical protein